MVKQIYEQGNIELLTMFESKTFDQAIASRIIANILDLNQPILGLHGHSTTYLYEAQENNNVDAVRFLLENGANPNLDIPELLNGCPLHDLHFLWQEMGGEAQQRLEIAKMFFDFGADPDIPYDGESLYDHVKWEIFHRDVPHDLEYLKRFFILLLAYGGGSKENHSRKPHILEPIDKERINEYDFKVIMCKDRHYLEGHLFNPDGLDIGMV